MAHFPGVPVAAVTDAEHEGPAERPQGLEQHLVVVQVVLEIGVLNQHKVASDVRETRAYRVAFSARPILQITLTRG